MSNLILNNHKISNDIITILKDIKTKTRYLKDIKEKAQYVFVTCPFHKDGNENTPACSINTDPSSQLPIGTFHCFACGARGQLDALVNKCFGKELNDPFGKSWLIDNYSEALIEDTSIDLPLINLDRPDISLDLSNYDFSFDNPGILYLVSKRNISKQVAEFFSIGYDKANDAVVFVVRDLNDKPLFITERSLTSHKFHIQGGSFKYIYLLNEIIKNNYSQVCVCESQINALTCWSYGYPAIALLGTGSKEQMQILNKSGIRHFILLFDGDFAGRQGAAKFKHSISDQILVTDIQIPQGKDVNDLSLSEFNALISTSSNKPAI